MTTKMVALRQFLGLIDRTGAHFNSNQGYLSIVHSENGSAAPRSDCVSRHHNTSPIQAMTDTQSFKFTSSEGVVESSPKFLGFR